VANTKEIRTKIKSIESTKKITRAMEMVAVSKMRRAQERMLASRPYAEKIFNVVDHLAKGHSVYRHPFLVPRPPKRAGIILVASDRGLCGGLNVNLFRALVEKVIRLKDKNIEPFMGTLGKKAELFAKRLGIRILASLDHWESNPSAHAEVGLARVMLAAYYSGEIDTLYIVYNSFINTMVQKPTIQKILPIAPAPEPEEEDRFKLEPQVGKPWDYIYEPEPTQLIDLLLNRFIEAQIYQAVVENYACEQAARVVAMKNATENAVELIGEFKLAYNQARQAAITQELSEIIGGASAV